MRPLSRSFLGTLSLAVTVFFILGSFILVPEVFERNRHVAWHFSLMGFLVFQPLAYTLLSEMLCRQAADLYKFRFSLKTSESRLYDRLITLSVLALSLLMPIFRVSAMTPALMTAGAVAWVVVTEILLLLSGQWTRADFQHDVILVRGFNFRKYYGMSSKSMTVNGIYLYEEFDGFSLEGERLVLFLSGTGGRLSLRLPENLAVPVTAYLAQAKQLQRR